VTVVNFESFLGPNPSKTEPISLEHSCHSNAPMQT
jgi:hypothetical protein